VRASIGAQARRPRARRGSIEGIELRPVMVTMRPTAPLLLMAATIGSLWLITLVLVAGGLDEEGAGTLATGIALFVFGGLLRPLLGPLEPRSPIASPQRRPLVLTVSVIAAVFLFATALVPAVVPVLWVGVLAPIGFGVATWTEVDDRARHGSGDGA
jgi:hypothetical protein